MKKKANSSSRVREREFLYRIDIRLFELKRERERIDRMGFVKKKVESDYRRTHYPNPDTRCSNLDTFVGLCMLAVLFGTIWTYAL